MGCPAENLDRSYGAAARLVVYMRDHKLTLLALAQAMSPVVAKSTVGTWIRQISVPSPDYRRQLDELTRGFVPEGGWGPTVRELAKARAMLVRAELVRVECEVVAAARTVARAERVEREVRPVPKARRQRWTRWQQTRLALPDPPGP